MRTNGTTVSRECHSLERLLRVLKCWHVFSIVSVGVLLVTSFVHVQAAAVAPRPVAGSVRPVVHGSTVKYNSKVRIGRGFSLAELKSAKIGKLEAKSLGIAVDARRRNRSQEGLSANTQRLKDYRANLVVFPRNSKKLKNGWAKDSSEIAPQLQDKVIMAPVAAAPSVETRKITSDEASANTSQKLKAAWNDARLVGFREKRAKERADKAAQEALKKAK